MCHTRSAIVYNALAKYSAPPLTDTLLKIHMVQSMAPTLMARTAPLWADPVMRPVIMVPVVSWPVTMELFPHLLPVITAYTLMRHLSGESLLHPRRSVAVCLPMSKLLASPLLYPNVPEYACLYYVIYSDSETRLLWGEESCSWLEWQNSVTIIDSNQDFFVVATALAAEESMCS